jgi:hypothetical protein
MVPYDSPPINHSLVEFYGHAAAKLLNSLPLRKPSRSQTLAEQTRRSDPDIHPQCGKRRSTCRTLCPPTAPRPRFTPLISSLINALGADAFTDPPSSIAPFSRAPRISLPSGLAFGVPSRRSYSRADTAEAEQFCRHCHTHLRHWKNG